MLVLLTKDLFGFTDKSTKNLIPNSKPSLLAKACLCL